MNVVQCEFVFNFLCMFFFVKGFELSCDIMCFNYMFGEFDGDNFVEFGEWFYYFIVMGELYVIDFWGWQFDGYYLIVNFFVFGD